MLVSKLTGALKSGGKHARSFGSAVKYNTVLFQKEDMNDVLREVPDPQFYLVGNPTPETYPYEKTPMNECIIPGGASNYFVNPPKPQWQYSQLENGLRIASIDKSGPNMKLGLYVNAGSRHEKPDKKGVAHLTHMLAYKSTAHLSYLRIMKTAESLSADLDNIHDREVIGYTCEGLRNQLPLVLPLLTGNVIFPRLLRWEVEDVIGRIGKHERGNIGETNERRRILEELLHQAAWHNNTLGNNLYTTKCQLHQNEVDNIAVKDFLLENFLPKNMVLVGSNVDHEELCKWAMRGFVDHPSLGREGSRGGRGMEEKKGEEKKGDGKKGEERRGEERKGDKSKYTGGIITVSNGETRKLSVAVAAGYSGAANLQELACGEVVKEMLKVKSEAYGFNHCYSDGGLAGVQVEGCGKEGKALVEKAVGLVKGLGGEEGALKSAKKRLARDLGEKNLGCTYFTAKLLMSGVTCADLVQKVESVQLSDLQAFVKSRPLTVALYGNTSTVPHYDEIRKMI